MQSLLEEWRLLHRSAGNLAVHIQSMASPPVEKPEASSVQGQCAEASSVPSPSAGKAEGKGDADGSRVSAEEGKGEAGAESEGRQSGLLGSEQLRVMQDVSVFDGLFQRRQVEC